MSIHRRLVTTCLPVALALGVFVVPGVRADEDTATCLVRNVSQGTAGRSFRSAVRASLRGDRIRVQGTCEAGIAIDRDISIVGVGDRARLTGLDRHRWVLRISSTATVTLHRLTVTGGRARRLPWPYDMDFSPGGGIRNLGTLTLTDTIVRRNLGSVGGGISNAGTLSLVRSTVAHNRLAGESSRGGGIVNRAGGVVTLEDSAVLRNDGEGISNGGTMTLLRSSVKGHGNGDYGGGITNQGSMTLVDSLVRDNHVQMTFGTFGGGGGIFNAGTMVMIRSAVTDNTALSDVFEDVDGGGIHNEGTLILVGTVVRRNQANRGGGIYSGGSRARSTLILRSSTVSDNGATEMGGGIANGWGAVTFRNARVTGNTAGTKGGGISNFGSLTLRRSSAVSHNTAARVGGGIWNDPDPATGATVTLRGGSTVTGNTPGDCFGTSAC